MKDENILKDRESNEITMRLFELGVNPTLVFAKRNTDKITHIYQITDIKMF